MSRPKRDKKKKETDKNQKPIALPPAVNGVLEIVAQVVRRKRQKPDTPALPH